jgi:hypothetical protein
MGIVNCTEEVHGVQVGLVNWTERLRGVQLGLVNLSEDGGLPVVPVANVGF